MKVAAVHILRRLAAWIDGHEFVPELARSSNPEAPVEVRLLGGGIETKTSDPVNGDVLVSRKAGLPAPVSCALHLLTSVKGES